MLSIFVLPEQMAEKSEAHRVILRLEVNDQGVNVQTSIPNSSRSVGTYSRQSIASFMAVVTRRNHRCMTGLYANPLRYCYLETSTRANGASLGKYSSVFSELWMTFAFYSPMICVCHCSTPRRPSLFAARNATGIFPSGWSHFHLNQWF